MVAHSLAFLAFEASCKSQIARVSVPWAFYALIGSLMARFSASCTFSASLESLIARFSCIRVSDSLKGGAIRLFGDSLPL